MSIEERAFLKDIAENDLRFILDWRNQESIRKVMFNHDMISWEQHIQWFKQVQTSVTALSKVFYFDDVPYGVLNITQIDPIHNRCEWGFYIGEPEAPKGMGTVLGYTALNYIFRELKIQKLDAEVLDFNDKSIYFHKKLGFNQEGKRREYVVKNGQYIDVVLFGYLATEWDEQYLALKELLEGRII
ncbi:UDP-4-amino-4,6-dideoxy-N-acetyl-beta-L-altrosamine N-acetyltransferase [Sporosarcina limicola]|uniref:UDP-4-amino-4, 6-dideoxy-N-acetyl-beta-L-altrosamine N-acetyltransferase n=1 Tax=Sporosarcina limicola TaxID=34101 RepID=A0A927MJI1_9BACL|nr:UDP-4-amino-4,6-dideoxy-N-acetyl-beta-L-altrosamine N-acetyltransferase [Sporosarcina limicola]MBE1555021.1 UDP-4-amino-4,6-dideoxy-N-acetyl-beta-L-altrosamine N-acetyltransferase [Sporosarcina limicola]